MMSLPGNLLSSVSVDADMVRRLHGDDPFFRARAERYAQLDDAIRALEIDPEAATIAHKYLDMLKRRREAIMTEMVDMIVKATPAAPSAIWTEIPRPITTLKTWRWS